LDLILILLLEAKKSGRKAKKALAKQNLKALEP